MKTFTVQNESGQVYRVVEIIAGAISKVERDGVYYDVEEDFIIDTNEELF